MSTLEPMAGQFWWPKKGAERVIIRVAPNKAGEVVVTYAEAFGSKGVLTIPVWKAWVQESGAKMALPDISMMPPGLAGIKVPATKLRTTPKDVGKSKR